MFVVQLLLFVVPLTHSLHPNFVFFLTDDQDLLLHSMDHMKKTVKLVANQGVTFTNFFVNSPVCCPSRSTLLTGKYPHNCHVYNNSVSGGCAGLQWREQQEAATIAPILKSEGGYRTFYAGKYLNQYGEKDTGGVGHVPKGYDWWLGLQGNSKYYNYTLSVNGSGHFFGDDYLTDKITEYALEFLNEGATAREKFFMMLAPPACHAPFTPASRHKGLFPDLVATRSLPFNATPTNKHWLVQMPPQSLPADVPVLDQIYRDRLRALQSVDDMVEAVLRKLKGIRVLDNTFVIFTSDNGFHIGQFTQPWDKRQPYESDIHLPFLVRGPQVPPKTVSSFPVSIIDVLPTILDLAEINHTPELDGVSFKRAILRESGGFYKRDILVEYWGEGDSRSVDPRCPWGPDAQISECLQEAWCKCQDSRNNTYACVLALSTNTKVKFCEFEGGFVEAYDLVADPHELYNMKMTTQKSDYYKEVLRKLRECRGDTCRIKSFH